MNRQKLLSTMAAGVIAFASLGLSSTAFAGPEVFYTVQESSEQRVDHSAWDQILATYLTLTPDNRTVFDYAGVSDAHKKTLKDYIARLEATDPTKLSRDEAFAFWANVYNAVTIDVVLDNFPVKSIMSIRSGITPGPWRRKLISIGGEKLSLNHVEHQILREYFGDNRVHYAVNCASYGCPNLATKAFTAENLEEMLNAGARDYINHDRGVRVENGKIIASSIYKWFKEDFGDNDAGVLEHARKFADPELKAALDGATKVDKFDYDWSLNSPE